MALVAVLGTCLLWRSDDWQPASLVVALAAIGLLGQVRWTTVGTMRVNATIPVTALTAVLLGPAPACILEAFGNGLSSSIHKRPRQYVLVNSIASALAALTGGALFALADSLDWAERGTATFPLWVGATALIISALNFAFLAPSEMLEGTPFRRAVRRGFAPALPLEVCGAALAAGSAHAYLTIGFDAIVGLWLSVMLLLWLLSFLAREERRARQLAQAQADRIRVVAAVHDDALQTIAAVRQDLMETLEGDADKTLKALAALGDASDSLRRLVGDLRQPTVDLGAEVDRIRERLRVRADVEVEIRIPPAMRTYVDETISAVIREGAANVEQHAQCSHVSVAIDRVGDSVIVEIVDDGVGSSLDVRRAPSAGHFGLALLAHRCELRGGELRAENRLPSGFLLRAVVPMTL
jgi:signal transduction histidine kinase